MLCERCNTETHIIYVTKEHSKVCEKCYDELKQKERIGDDRNRTEKYLHR